MNTDMDEPLRQVVRRALSLGANPHVYTTHLLYEGILAMPEDAETAGWKREVLERTLRGNDALLTLPFCNLLHALGELLLMPSLWERHLRELREMLSRAVVSPEGAWLHPAPNAGGWALLLDGFQEEASRLAKGAKLLRGITGETETAEVWEGLCMRQFQIHRDILRDPRTGLWHNGRGWIAREPGQLSPGAWSRGHGWLLRGLVESMEALPRDGVPFQTLRGMLLELSETLGNLQDAEGMWHVLLQRPPEDSAAESSGSALIAAAWLKALRLDLLPASCGAAAMRTARALARRFVDAEGRVLSVSPGPGPLSSETPYLNNALADGDAHGDLAISFLLSECLRTYATPLGGPVARWTPSRRLSA